MFLYLTAHTPVGVFTGTLNRDSAQKDDLAAARDALQTSTPTYIVIFKDDTEIYLAGDTIKNSVIVYEIRS